MADVKDEVNCRIGSLETCVVVLGCEVLVNCRIGSLEMSKY